LLVLLKLITPPLWVIPLVSLEPESTDDPEMVASVVVIKNVDADFECAAAVPARDDRPVGTHWVANLPQVTLGPVNRTRLALVWLAGSILSLTVTGLRVRRWNRLLRFVEPAPDDVQEGVDLLANSMGIAHPPRACWFPGASAPMLWALGCRASLIVPCKLWDRLDDRQRTTLLVHELAHLRRKDHWVRIVELLATAFYWWLPLAWIARWALREAEEQCCDAWVVSTCPDAHRAYAETLLDTVDFLSETGRAVPMAASGFGHAHHLKRRVTMIMQGTTPRGLSWTGLLSVFGLATLLLPLSPTWAQKADDENRSETDRDVQEQVEDSEDAKLDVIKRKLAEEIRRIESIETKAREKERAAAERGRDRRKSERSESSEKAESEKADADRESAERDHEDKDKDKIKTIIRREGVEHPEITPKVRAFTIIRGVDPAEKDIVKAKLELERAHAQLRQAESQLRKLGEERRAKADKRTDAAPPSHPSDVKGGTKPKETIELHVKPDLKVDFKYDPTTDVLEVIKKDVLVKPDLQHDFKFEVRKDMPEKVEKDDLARIVIPKVEALRRREAAAVRERKLFESKKLRDEASAEAKKRREEALAEAKKHRDEASAHILREKDRKIADLEKKLDELINEVKSLKSERNESR
jgi:beta-lactamase regulating signal transducer with metallopeptidase domain